MWLTLLLLALAVLLAAALLSAGKVSPILTGDGRPAENGITEKHGCLSTAYSRG